jgi:hypothetical protein
MASHQTLPFTAHVLLYMPFANEIWTYLYSFCLLQVADSNVRMVTFVLHETCIRELSHSSLTFRKSDIPSD